QAQPIHLSAPDFDDLHLLDSLVAGKRIVLLGESSHGTEEYSRLKFRLIRYLHERHGFRVVLFESPMTAGSFVNLALDSTVSEKLVLNSLQPFWHTNTVAQL